MNNQDAVGERQQMLQVLERILDSKHEADKWAHEAEKLYVELGGQKLSLIAPTARERLLARKSKRNPTPVSVGGEDASQLWFNKIRPIINAIGEISVQEAMDAVERMLRGER